MGVGGVCVAVLRGGMLAPQTASPRDRHTTAETTAANNNTSNQHTCVGVLDLVFVHVRLNALGCRVHRQRYLACTCSSSSSGSSDGGVGMA